MRRSSPRDLQGGALDPIFQVLRFSDPLDREIAGLIAALLAYGQVAAVCSAVRSVLDSLSPSPRQALLEKRHLRPSWGVRFRYRFNSAFDLRRLCEAAAFILRSEGSLGAAMAARRDRAGDLAGGLALWVADLRRAAAVRGRLTPGLRFLLPDPALGGACKRWWLYLRWMVRPADGLDLGAWADRIPASELLVPLDTHWIRIGRRLGLTARRTPNARMAREITEALRRICPQDPLRFDYPVCHLGIGGGCPPVLTRAHCRACPLQRICATGLESRRARSAGSRPVPSEGPRRA